MKLGARPLVELCWWWEAPPAGEPVLLRDPLTARLYLNQLAADPGHAAALRRFLAAGAPPLPAPPEDGEVLDQLAHAVATGKVRLAKTLAEPLSSWGARVEEELVAPVVRPEPAPAPDAEDICWPCLQRATASARALREAAADGVPFVA
jgi:hypothetical protein